MCSLKENKILISIAILTPFVLFYCDEQVLTWVRFFHDAHPDFDRILRAVDRVMYYAAHGTTMIAGAFLFCLFGRYVNRRFYKAGKSILVGLIVSGLSVQIFKHIIGRARPRVSDSLVIIGPSLMGGYDSFPSGHSAMAFCLAAILSRYYPSYWILFYFFAAVEGLARIDGTSHFPADVMAGAIVGIVVAKVLEIRMLDPGKGLGAGDHTKS